MKALDEAVKGRRTQRDPILGRTDMVKNSEGGYVFPVGLWERVDRFLILGTEGGSYYVQQKDLTKANIDSLLEAIQADGLRFVRRAVEISDAGRAPKNDQALFALALAAAHGDADTKTLALAELPRVARIGTHLFQFVDWLKAMRGTGRAVKRALAAWYLSKPSNRLAVQMTKYRRRHGWSHADVLRVAHPDTTGSPVTNALCLWATHPEDHALVHSLPEYIPGELKDRILARADVSPEEVAALAGGTPAEIREVLEEVAKPAPLDATGAPRPHHDPFRRVRRILACDPAFSTNQHLTGFLALQAAESEDEVVGLLNAIPTLTHEMIPSHLKGAKAWGALVRRGMPMMALVRNLPTLTRLGLLPQLGELEAIVCEQLVDGDRLRRARVHPLSVLVALRTYSEGRGVRSNAEWEPNQAVTEALDSAFHAAFGNLPPIKGGTYIGLDVSGSMGTARGILGVPTMTAAVVSGAMAMCLARQSDRCVVFGFAGQYRGIPIGKADRLDNVMRLISGHTYGATDAALPMIHARKNGMKVQNFIVITDNETWSGGMFGFRRQDVHPVQAIQTYRKATGIPAKHVTLAVTSTGFKTADPKDGGMLDIAGFDLSVPRIVEDFFGAGL